MQLKWVFVFLFSTSLIVFAQSEISKKQWQTVNVIAENKLEPRASFTSYPSPSHALRTHYTRSPRVKSLDGSWKFFYVPGEKKAPEKFWENGFQDKRWRKIKVPSNWEMHGYGYPLFQNRSLVKVSGKNITPVKGVERVNGLYRRDFKIPSTWDGTQYFLRFDGVDSAFKVWVNGKYVGYSQDSKTGAEFNISKYANVGLNKIAVQVFNFSDGSFLENHAYWKLSGIYRRVYIHSVPKTHVKDFFVKTGLTKNNKQGSLVVRSAINQMDDGPKPLTLTASLRDKNEREVAKAKTSVDSGKKGVALSTLKLNLARPLLWSAEKPYLYNLILSLEDQQGELIESLSSKVGFRQVEVKGNQLLVNGKPVKLRGINRHEHDPDHGHSLTEERIREEIILLKGNNFNFVRTGGYPNDPLFYEICNELGIYVLNEMNVNVKSTKNKNIIKQPAWEKAILNRASAMVHRDKNHPSVILWGLGQNLKSANLVNKVHRLVKSIDPTRPTYSHGHEGVADVLGVLTKGKNSFNEIQKILKNEVQKPRLIGNFTYASGNAMGGYVGHWDSLERLPAFAGGIINDFKDQGIRIVNSQIPRKPAPRLSGNKGLAENETWGRSFVPGVKEEGTAKGLFFSDLGVNGKANEVKKAHQWIDFKIKKKIVKEKEKTEVEFYLWLINKHRFSRLDEFDFNWELIQSGKVSRRGQFSRIQCAPGKSVKVDLPIKMSRLKENEYHLNLYAKYAEPKPWSDESLIVAMEQLSLPIGKTVHGKELKIKAGVDYLETEENIRVFGEGFAMDFDKESMRMKSLFHKEHEILGVRGDEEAFGLSVQRAQLPSDKSDVKALQTRLGSMTSAPKSIDIKKEDNGIVRVRTKHKYLSGGVELFLHSMLYTINGDGAVSVKNEVRALTKSTSGLPRVGLILPVERSLVKAKWHGRGPHENYPDRNRAAFVGIYESTVQHFVESYMDPQSQGERTDLRWLFLSNRNGDGIKITGDQYFNMALLPFKEKMLDKVSNLNDLKEAHANYLYLDHLVSGVGGGRGKALLNGSMVFTFYLEPID